MYIPQLHPDLWEKLNGLAKELRECNAPFGKIPLHLNPFQRKLALTQSSGGMQMVVCGDFFQLPPVADRQDNRNCLICGKSASLGQKPRADGE